MIWLLCVREKLSFGLFSRLVLEDFCLNCEKTCLGFRVSHVSTRMKSAGAAGAADDMFGDSSLVIIRGTKTQNFGLDSDTLLVIDVNGNSAMDALCHKLTASYKSGRLHNTPARHKKTNVKIMYSIIVYLDLFL